MKLDIAVLADIHGNYAALERCIDYALSQDIRTFIFLGDYVGELAYPEKTMRMIYDMDARYECFFIRGNKEDYWLDHRANGETGWKDHDSTTGSLLYTYRRLTEKDLRFYEQLQYVRKITIGDMPEMIICHGSPYKVNEKLLPSSERTFEIMDSVETPIILCGHTHEQYRADHNGKVVLNPGSVGVPLHSGGYTQFMILHSSRQEQPVEFISLDYDVDKVIKELHESKLDEHAPYWCRVTENLLRKGTISHGKVLARAMAICEEENGNCIWPDVPEKYWKQAVEEMIGGSGECRKLH